MHMEILVEERSSEAALHLLVPRIVPACSFTIHPHQGRDDLLAELPGKLMAYAKWMPEDWRIVVLLDEDRQDCMKLKSQVLAMGKRAKLPAPLLCRIAVEELEAWFFGDVPALVAAYPGVAPTLPGKRRFRDPDAIKGGTWEALEQVLQAAGHFPGGLAKIQAARTIAQRMNVEQNASRSFQVFRDGLRGICGDARGT